MLAATLTGRQVSIIRAVAKYLRQAGLGFSDAYIERTVIGHPDIARLLVELFDARLDPDRHDRDLADQIASEIEEALDAVPSLDEDRILRSFLSVVRAIVRTNAFQPARRRQAATSTCRSSSTPRRSRCCRCRGRSSRSSCYSPRVEGGPPARRQGGPRRHALVGSPRGLPHRGARPDEGPDGQERADRPGRRQGRLRASSGRRRTAAARRCRPKAIACYKMFLSGLLDVTDNIVDGEVVAPERVVRYDDDDPYLVVAADKGTATFSDIANEVSAQLRLLAGRRVRLGRLAGLRPQADGDHRARRLGVGQAPLPRARHRHPDHGLHRRRDRRHVGRRVRQRDAALAPHPG